jgi:hypothetical protein
MKRDRLLLFFALLVSLSACGGNAESWFKPDPSLETQQQNQNNNPVVNPVSQTTEASLPNDFPNQIPQYQNSTLVEVIDEAEQTKTVWQTQDAAAKIKNFYQRQLKANDWQISQDFDNSTGDSLTANRDDLELTVSVLSGITSNQTRYTISYQPLSSTIADNPVVNSTKKVDTTRNPDELNNSTDNNNIPTNNANIPSNNQVAVVNFDLEEIPEQLRPNVEDVAALDIITSDSTSSQIDPNAAISRRDFARWLVTANNRFYADIPGKQVRLAGNNSASAFTDVNPNDPDFAVIQGLAEAGIIPSSLSGDSSTLFRPDAPLTREDILRWKVPLDVRKGLPSATVDTIKETWGFQDASNISSAALSSLYADFQNGDRANIRRVFGYTTLFQPKKPITRAEAAAMLWFFGNQGDGRTAQEVQSLTVENQPTNNQPQ